MSEVKVAGELIETNQVRMSVMSCALDCQTWKSPATNQSARALPLGHPQTARARTQTHISTRHRTPTKPTILLVPTATGSSWTIAQLTCPCPWPQRPAYDTHSFPTPLLTDTHAAHTAPGKHALYSQTRYTQTVPARCKDVGEKIFLRPRAKHTRRSCELLPYAAHIYGSVSPSSPPASFSGGYSHATVRALGPLNCQT